MPPDPTRSLPLWRSFRKTVSIYPRSAPDSKRNESFVLQIKEIPSPSLDILSFYCFDAQYILTILSSGYHLNNTKANLTFVGSVSKMSIFFGGGGGGARLSFLHNTDSSLLRTAKYKVLKTLLALPLPRGYRFNMVTVFTRISATQMKRRPRILRQKVNKPRPKNQKALFVE